MRAVDIIIKKRDQGELSREEIGFFVKGFTLGDIPDYQASAFAMAVVLNGMTPRETTDLTLAMAHSGQMLDLSDVVDLAVDKHSSGGVGDKTTLAVLPIVAACGLPAGKMSGRGLGLQRRHARQTGIHPGLPRGPHHRGIQASTQGEGDRPDRSIPRPGACGWQTVFPARCDRHGAVHSVDRLVHHVQESWRRGRRRSCWT